MTLRTLSRVGICALLLTPAASAESWLEFDGVDDRVTVPYDPSFPTEVFTVAARVRLEPPTRRAAIIARGEDDNSFNLSWQLYVSPGGALEIMLEDDQENNHCYPNTCMGAPQPTCSAGDLFIADGDWHHAAATRAASGSLSLYIDGQLRVTCTGTGEPSANNFQDLTIGCTHGSIGPLPPGETEPPIWFFPGRIDEPAMWSSPLTAAQVQSVHLTSATAVASGLVGFWDFEEAAGQTVGDRSGAGNDGFLGSDPGADAADPSWIVESPPITVPAAPSDLEAVATSWSTIELTWRDRSDDEDGFIVERSSSGSFAEIATLPANTTAFTDTGLAAGATFEYRLAAENVAGMSAPSNVASATTPLPTPCIEDEQTLCLNEQRFRVEADWRDFEDQTGVGRAVVSSRDSGLFWFFVASNWEVMIKVLDGCGLNERFWVFASATTNVEYTLRITDTETGVVRSYTNTLGNAAPAITDTNAFATCL